MWGMPCQRFVCRLKKLPEPRQNYFWMQGKRFLKEFTLKNSRRDDLIALSPKQKLSIIEVKFSRRDFTGDHKWPEYIGFADYFYFAVAEDFPQDILPDERMCGIILSDGFDALITRPAPLRPLANGRRAHLIRQLAVTAMRRLEI
jgi:hypothetical protein